jgi:hypothetical protein
MPPHCDSLDGPVVRAAQRALDADNVALVFPFVLKHAEREIADAFHRVKAARARNEVCRQIADRYFFETVVRLHRAGEGAPFTGLKPAGLDVGPIIPAAEKAIENQTPIPLEEALITALREEVATRFEHLEHLRAGAHRGLDGARAYVGAMLGLQTWAHGVYQAMKATAHGGGHTHE